MSVEPHACGRLLIVCHCSCSKANTHILGRHMSIDCVFVLTGGAKQPGRRSKSKVQTTPACLVLPQASPSHPLSLQLLDPTLLLSLSPHPHHLLVQHHPSGAPHAQPRPSPTPRLLLPGAMTAPAPLAGVIQSLCRSKQQVLGLATRKKTMTSRPFIPSQHLHCTSPLTGHRATCRQHHLAQCGAATGPPQQEAWV